MRFLVFIAIYFGVYGSAHYYFFQKVKALGCGPLAHAWTAGFLGLMLVAPFLVFGLQRLRMEGAARILALVSYAWMAFIFLFLCLTLLLQPVQWVSRLWPMMGHGLSGPALFILASTAALLIIAIGYGSAQTPRLERVVLTSAKWPQARPALRIVQVSDLHIGLVIQKKRLQRLLARVNELHPDVIVSTGDLVDAPIRHSQACLEILQGLRAPQGRFAVLGNHEVDAGLAHAVAFTQAAGFRLLRQETVSVPGWFAISGVDDPATGQGRHAWPSLEDKTLFSILLKHRPVPESESGHFDLQLSGHVHHGQIFPFGLLFRLFHPYYAGLYRLDRFFLYVSRGTGTWGPPVRFLAPPEITLIEVGAAPGKS